MDNALYTSLDGKSWAALPSGSGFLNIFPGKECVVLITTGRQLQTHSYSTGFVTKSLPAGYNQSPDISYVAETDLYYFAFANTGGSNVTSYSSDLQTWTQFTTAYVSGFISAFGYLAKSTGGTQVQFYDPKSLTLASAINVGVGTTFGVVMVGGLLVAIGNNAIAEMQDETRFATFSANGSDSIATNGSGFVATSSGNRTFVQNVLSKKKTGIWSPKTGRRKSSKGLTLSPYLRIAA